MSQRPIKYNKTNILHHYGANVQYKKKKRISLLFAHRLLTFDKKDSKILMVN